MSVSTAPHLGSAETLIGLELKIACDTKRAHEQQQQAHKERLLIPSTLIFIAMAAKEALETPPVRVCASGLLVIFRVPVT